MNYPPPPYYAALRERCTAIGFDMPSEMPVGQLLKVLVAAKPGGRFLELGTGMGLSLAWMIGGLTDGAHIVSLDNDRELTTEVTRIIDDPRVTILCVDGDDWIRGNPGERFDLIFADTWPGKYRLLDEVLAFLHPGGLYVVDDMLPQNNWPEGHANKATTLTETLLAHPSLHTVQIDWSTGVMLGVKR